MKILASVPIHVNFECLLKYFNLNWDRLLQWFLQSIFPKNWKSLMNDKDNCLRPFELIKLSHRSDDSLVKWGKLTFSDWWLRLLSVVVSDPVFTEEEALTLRQWCRRYRKSSKAGAPTDPPKTQIRRQNLEFFNYPKVRKKI